MKIEKYDELVTILDFQEYIIYDERQSEIAKFSVCIWPRFDFNYSTLI